uniref:HMT1 n=1 Tax=Arundo donax TaxID=35708 RepID=A0A0A9G8S4_ARUDO
MRLAPASCHVLASASKLLRPKHSAGSHLFALPSQTSPLFGYTAIAFFVCFLNSDMMPSMN